MSAMAFLAGMGAGYLNAKDKNRENERQDAKDKREQSLFDMTMAEKKQAQADRDALRNAGQDAVVTPEQGPPTEAMVAATPDGREPANIGYLAGNGTSARHFATRGLADAEVTQMNSLEGRFSRQQSAMQGVGDYAGAQKLQLDNMTLKKHASDLLKEGTGDALSAAIGGQTPEEVKAIYNLNGAKKVRNIIITPFEVDHPVLGKQRSAKITGTFEDGSALNVPDAQQMQAQLLGVAKKLDLDTKWAEIGNKKTHDAGTLAVAQQNANTNESYRRDIAANGAARASGASSNKPFKMDEYDKIRIREAATSVRDAEKMVNDSMKGLMPGDGPIKSPAVAHAQGVLKQAKRSQFITHVETGQITADSLASKIMGVAKSKEDVFKSLKDLANDVGTGLSDEVAAHIQENDQWKKLSAPPVAPATTAPPKSAPALAAQGIQPTTAAPVAAPAKYSYAAQMAQANEARMALQASNKAKSEAQLAARAEQDRLVEEKRKAFLASRGAGATHPALSSTQINFSR